MVILEANNVKVGVRTASLKVTAEARNKFAIDEATERLNALALLLGNYSVLGERHNLNKLHEEGKMKEINKLQSELNQILARAEKFLER